MLLEFTCHEIALCFASTSRFHVWITSAAGKALRLKLLDAEPILFTAPMPVALHCSELGDTVLRVAVNGCVFTRQSSCALSSDPQFIAVKQFESDDSLDWPLHTSAHNLDGELSIKEDGAVTRFSNDSSWRGGPSPAGKHIATLFGGKPVLPGSAFTVKLSKQGDTMVGVGSKRRPTPECALDWQDAVGTQYAGIRCWDGTYFHDDEIRAESTHQKGRRIENGSLIRVTTLALQEEDSDWMQVTWWYTQETCPAVSLEWRKFASARFSMCDEPYFPFISLSGRGRLEVTEARGFTQNLEFISL